jgi:hypothetical protein
VYQFNLQTHSYQATCPHLPLAVYREVAAHLRQVDGVSVDLIAQTTSKFDYYASQIEGMLVNFLPNLSQSDRQKVAKIIEYYSQKHGEWQIAEL